MISYKNRRKKHHIFIILNSIGFFFIICALILSRKSEKYFIISFILLFLGIILIIPDAYIFYIKSKHKNEGLSGYWFVKFLTLPFILLILVIFFLVRLIY